MSDRPTAPVVPVSDALRSWVISNQHSRGEVFPTHPTMREAARELALADERERKLRELGHKCGDPTHDFCAGFNQARDQMDAILDAPPTEEAKP